jgi:sugar phosphate isomerase/epimerase
MYGPYPFTGEESRKGWEALEPQLGFKGSGFFGRSVSQVKSIMKEFGFTVPSLHTDLDTLDTNMSALADAAHSMGSAYVVLPSIPADRRKTMDDYRKMAALFNKIGANAQMNGVRFAYHNHGYGFHPVEGKRPIDIIFDETDPNSVFLELDLYWTTAGGSDPAELMRKHAGRYKMIHIKDMKEQVRFSGDGGDPSQWIGLFPYMSSAGDGVLDLPGLLKTAKETGIEHFIVEQDMVAQPEIALKRSFEYLKSL